LPASGGNHKIKSPSRQILDHQTVSQSAVRSFGNSQPPEIAIRLVIRIGLAISSGSDHSRLSFFAARIPRRRRYHRRQRRRSPKLIGIAKSSTPEYQEMRNNCSAERPQARIRGYFTNLIAASSSHHPDAEDDGMVTANWTGEMQEQFDRFRQELTDVIKNELRGTEERLEDRLSQRFDERFSATESRLSRHFDERFSAAESRLSRHVDDRFSGVESRLSEQFKTAAEHIQDQVKLLAESFGGTLDTIRRDILNLEQTVNSTFTLHAQVLSDHTREIASLKRRLPQ
jgi:hypothetical protein